jgi:hypothetical protein
VLPAVICEKTKATPPNEACAGSNDDTDYIPELYRAAGCNRESLCKSPTFTRRGLDHFVAA